MHIQWILMSIHEYFSLGQTEGKGKVVISGDRGVQGEITPKNTYNYVHNILILIDGWVHHKWNEAWLLVANWNMSIALRVIELLKD